MSKSSWVWEWRFLAAAALVVRLFLVHFTRIPQLIENRVEVANSQVGVKAVREAAFLLSHSVPIYENRTSCQPIFQSFDRIGLPTFLYILLDLLCGFLAFRITDLLKTRQRERSKAKAEDEDDREDDHEDFDDYDPESVALVYLFNPFTLFVCLAKSSALFTSATSLAAIFFALQRKKILAMAVASLAAYFSFYSASLAIPTAILACQHPQRKLRQFASAVALFFSWFVTWHITTMVMTGSWSYLHTTIGCNLHVADLRPNIGLAWYLFVEMFDHFRSFFLAVFQLHHGIYITPATIKFRKDPLMLAFFFTAVSSVFKPYPTIADTVLLLTFLAFLGGSLLARAKTLPVYVFALCLASLLGPINWHYWIRQGSGNANFFYAVVLLYNGSTVVMVLDVIKQWVGRELERANPGISLDKVYQR